MVTVALPDAAELPAARVRTLSPAETGFGEKEAVTPLGSPVAVRVTLPANPFWGMTATSASAELPGTRLTWAGPAAIEKPCGLMVRLKVVEAVWDPETPLMVTV